MAARSSCTTRTFTKQTRAARRFASGALCAPSRTVPMTLARPRTTTRRWCSTIRIRRSTLWRSCSATSRRIGTRRGTTIWRTQGAGRWAALRRAAAPAPRGTAKTARLPKWPTPPAPAPMRCRRGCRRCGKKPRASPPIATPSTGPAACGGIRTASTRRPWADLGASGTRILWATCRCTPSRCIMRKPKRTPRGRRCSPTCSTTCNTTCTTTCSRQPNHPRPTCRTCTSGCHTPSRRANRCRS
mmetsp:Transcript_103834/g.318019  ORF Transcript_103834/g.318019 Transcript_103834/m.318019 type:complete len:243 (+) Transcript_103834:791-1519(+)